MCRIVSTIPRARQPHNFSIAKYRLVILKSEKSLSIYVDYRNKYRHVSHPFRAQTNKGQDNINK